MRILWLTPALPCPTTGNRVRQYNLIKRLSDEHSITVLSFVSNFEADYLDRLRSHCADVVPLPLRVPPALGEWHNRIRAWRRSFFDHRPHYIQIYPMYKLRCELARLLSTYPFDLVNAEFLHSAQLVDDLTVHRTILIEHNIESAIQRRRFTLAERPSRRFRDWVEWRKLRRYEAMQLRRFPAIVAVSDVDAALARKLAPGLRVHVVPNGVDVSSFTPREGQDPMQRKGLLFSGTMDYGPNVDGAIYFCREIWPRVRQARPELTLTIAGARPGPEVLALGDQPGVTVTGFVEDMRPYLWQAAVSVVPLRMGGGTRLKILESMAAGCAVVSTTLGAEGLHFDAGKDLLVADSTERFALSVIDLLDNPERRVDMARRAHQKVMQFYDWESIAPRLSEVYHHASAHKDAGR